jgi:hypothetical protein
MSKTTIVFNRTIEASSGTLVDFDRASLLMDKELLQRAFDAIRNDRDNARRGIRTFVARNACGTATADVTLGDIASHLRLM